MCLAYLYVTAVLPAQRSATRTPEERKAPPASRGQTLLFVISVLVLVFALLSPIDTLGDRYSFSVHMVQHLVLATVWPPILLLSIPTATLRPLLDRWMVLRLVRLLTWPAAALLLFNSDMAAWHIPALYDLTLTSTPVHIAEHLSFMILGLIAWWPVLSPIPELRLSYAGQILYLFVSTFPMMGLGIFLTFFNHPLYHPYLAAPTLWGVSHLVDQQIGGMIMWMPGNAPYFLAMIGAFIAWFDHGELNEREVALADPAIRTPSIRG